ncbi:hypothetical protein FRC0036_02306 [Corynebacterium diphtheriae]|nr:hypothetical protein CIP107537_02261 [Corynebacterium diphtheriae]CAB0716739.1 hypothetical protein FRC0030_02307 [Corynebacterium diphtheriae]CAB0717299.1 hypothetical protein FRC0036_02306 [Corynebacterium diphtheriae]CAB0778135.1 hypothetical protein FRC0172_02067 [Corynebacterium diphtheriae]CAB0827518.1 hypothetical protein FRC0292_02174 [Corynebacterium diphtheriae]
MHGSGIVFCVFGKYCGVDGVAKDRHTGCEHVEAELVGLSGMWLEGIVGKVYVGSVEGMEVLLRGGVDTLNGGDEGFGVRGCVDNVALDFAGGFGHM